MKTRNKQKGGNPAYILWAIGALILLGASQLSRKKYNNKNSQLNDLVARGIFNDTRKNNNFRNRLYINGLSNTPKQETPNEVYLTPQDNFSENESVNRYFSISSSPKWSPRYSNSNTDMNYSNLVLSPLFIYS